MKTSKVISCIFILISLINTSLGGRMAQSGYTLAVYYQMIGSIGVVDRGLE